MLAAVVNFVQQCSLCFYPLPEAFHRVFRRLQTLILKLNDGMSRTLEKLSFVYDQMGTCPDTSLGFDRAPC